MKRILLLIATAFLLLYKPYQAQSDTKFWFVAPDISQNVGRDQTYSAVATSTAVYSAGCQVSDTINIEPAGIVTNDTTICSGQSVLLTTVAGCQGDWEYQEDFENAPGPEWNQSITFPFNNTQVSGPYGNTLLELSLNNLTCHDSMEVSFDLYIHDTWDGNGPWAGPDFWDLTFDNSQVIHTTFSNTPVDQSYPDNYLAANPSQTGAFIANLPVRCGSWQNGSCLYKIKRKMNHSSATLLAQFQAINIQELCDESWSFDNFKVKLLNTLTTTYLWSTGDTTPTISVSPTQTTTYYLTVTSGNNSYTDSVLVTVINSLSGVFGSDTLLCRGQSITLELPSGASSYLWSTGVTTPGITIDTAGQYWGQATNNACIYSDTINISFSNINAGIDQVILCSNPIQLNGSGALFYSWSPTTGLSNPYIPNPVASPSQTTTYTLSGGVNLGGNLVYNGDFENGDTGFTSQYSFAPNLGPQGLYWIGTNSQTPFWLFTSCNDHSSGSGNLMAVNGATTPNVEVWGQAVSVIPNTNYAFSAWVTNISSTQNILCELQFLINGGLQGNVFSSLPTQCNWSQFYVIWNSGNNTTANIKIINQSTEAGGNDFALDDISLAPIQVCSDGVSVYVADAGIINSDTTICLGDSISLTAKLTSDYCYIPDNLGSSFQQGLVAYYPFTGNSMDSSSYGNNGSVFGASLAGDRFGNPNNAYYFNGTSDYIRVNHSASLSIQNSISVITWVKTDDPDIANNGDIATVLSKHTTMGCRSYGLHLSDSTNGPWNADSLYMVLFSPNDNPNFTFISSHGVYDNNWHRVVSVYNYTSGIQNIYIDCKLSGSENLGQTNLMQDNEPFLFGCYGGGTCSSGVHRGFYHGYIDDTRIYNRALTSSELADLGITENVSSFLWSTGATTSGLTVTPTQTTTYYVTITYNGSSCVDSVKVEINNPQIDLLHDTAFCEGQNISIIAPSGFSSYLWSTGETTQTIVPSNAGIYWIQVPGPLGCPARDTINITTKPKPQININPFSAQICSGDSITLTGQSDLVGTSWQWSTTASTQEITVNPLVNSTYTLIGTLNGCADTALATVTIKPKPVVQILPANPSICQGDTLLITATSNLPGSSFIWTQGIFTASFQAFPSITTTYHVAVVKDGCMDTAFVTVHVNPIPSISISPANPSICEGDTLLLTAIAVPAGGTFLWNTGGVADTLTVIPSSPTTSYSVVYTFNTCSNTDSVTVIINPLPVINITPLNPHICLGDTIVLTASGSLTGLNWIWNTGQTTASITIQPLMTQIRVVTGFSGTCSGQAIDTITVHTPPPITITPVTPTICSGDSIELTVHSDATVTSFQWNTGATDTTITVSPVVNTTFNVTASNAYCESDTSIEVIVKPSPAPYIDPADTTICKGDTIQLTVHSDVPGVSYLWVFGSSQQQVSITPVMSTYYSVAAEANDCIDTASTWVNVNELPVFSLGVDGYYCDGDQVILEGPSGNYTYLWSDGSINETYIVTAPGEYWLMVREESCYYIDSINLKECSEIWVPNAFTPNGDNFNEEFKPKFKEITDYEMYIFNRWGEQIFKSSNPETGWDGRYKGSDLPSGVYYYLILYKGVGNIQYQVRHRVHGVLTLLR